MIYYILDTNTRTFAVKYSVSDVGTYMLGASIKNIIMFKTDENGVRQYIPTIPDVWKIQEELEAL